MSYSLQFSFEILIIESVSRFQIPAINSSRIELNDLLVRSVKMLLSTSLLIPAIFNLIEVHATLDVEPSMQDHSEIGGNSTTVTAVLTKPSSRAYNCFLGTNLDCNVFESDNDVGGIIGPVDFLNDGPKDGEIANAGNPSYDVLNEHRPERWSRSYLKIQEHNATHFATEIAWMFSNETEIVVDQVQVFLSNGNYTDDQSIQRSLLNLACSYRRTNNRLTVEDRVLRFRCYLRYELVQEIYYETDGLGVLLSTLKIAGAGYAFYQVADITLHVPIYQIANYHGYISVPTSRAKLCQMRVNKNCGPVAYEPQSVEGFKGFPHQMYSPPDGKIASGNNKSFKELDEYGANRWSRVNFPRVRYYNSTHLSFDVVWYLTAVHSTDDFRVYISNERYSSREPLSRRHLDLNPLCVKKFHGKYPPRQLTHSCLISLNKYRELTRMKELLMLTVWNVYDTAYAFYQVIDINAPSGSYENVSSEYESAENFTRHD